jgi:DNA-binding NarL/FixJ family response regulator
MKPEKRLKIAVADDHTIFRKAFVDALNYGNFNFDIVFHVSNGSELLFELEKNEVDLILLDLEMPVMSGYDALKLIKSKYPKIKVIILSMTEPCGVAQHLFKNGINGFLYKACEMDDLLDAIYTVMDNGYYFNDKTAEYFLDVMDDHSLQSIEDSQNKLSDRERDVLKCILQEKCAKQISTDLNISERTVENHRYNISKKIGTSNSIGMLVYALCNSLATITAEGKVVFE